MKTIYKYKLANMADTYAVMPAGAEILHAHEQGDNICVWALIDPRQTETEKRIFKIVGTGHEFAAEGMRYLGTAHFDGQFVSHIFEVKR